MSGTLNITYCGSGVVMLRWRCVSNLLCSSTQYPFLLNVCTCVCIYVCVSLQLTASGAHGSRGGSAPLPAVAARGLASVSVIIRLPATGVGLAQETSLSCPAVTLRPVQVGILSHAAFSFCATRCILKCVFSLSPGGPQSARGSIIGKINDIEFGIAILNASVTDGKAGGKVITATINNVPRTLGRFSASKSISLSHNIYTN